MGKENGRNPNKATRTPSLGAPETKEKRPKKGSRADVKGPQKKTHAAPKREMGGETIPRINHQRLPQNPWEVRKGGREKEGKR